MGIINSFKTAAKGLFNLPMDNLKNNSTKSGLAVYQYGQRNSYNNLGELETMKYPIATSFLYSPTYGIPRNVDLYSIRALSKTHWVRMFINVIIKTVVNTEWKIVPVDEEVGVSNQKVWDDVNSFFKVPSTNGEDIGYFNEVLIHDYLEVGEMMLGLVYNESLYESKSVKLTTNNFTVTKNEEEVDKGVESYKIVNKESFNVNVVMKVPRVELLNKGVTKKAGLIDVRVIDPASMTVNIDKHGDLPMDTPAFYQYLWTNPTIATPTPFFKREVVWVKNNPTSYEAYGQSPLISVMMVLETLIAAVRDNKLLFENNASPDGFLSYLTDNVEEAEKVANMLKNRLKNNPHKIVVGNEDHKFTSFRLSNQDLEWLNGMKFFKDLIGAIYNVPGDELGFTENSNRATAFGQNKVFIRNCVLPILKKLEMVWNKVIRTFYSDGVEPEVMFKFFYDDIDLQKAKKELQWGDLDRKVISINEVRTADGEEPVTWGDKPYEPVNPLSANSINGNGSNKGGYDNPSEKNDIGDKRNKDFHVEFDYDSEVINKKFVTSDSPNDEISGPLEEYLNKCFNFVSKEVRLILNKGLSMSETISELQALEGNVGIANLDGVVKAINDLYDLGIDNVEELTNMNVGALVNKGVITDVFAQQIMYGYTLPSGKSWKGFKGVNHELTKKMVDALIEGVNEGKGMKVLADELVSISDMSKSHALLISRTETSRILHGTELTSIAKAGIVVDKEWLTHTDSRTCDLCKRLNGQVVGFDKNFVDSKTGVNLFSPTAHPNCRCTLVYNYKGYKKSGSFARLIKSAKDNVPGQWVTMAGGRHVFIPRVKTEFDVILNTNLDLNASDNDSKFSQDILNEADEILTKHYSFNNELQNKLKEVFPTRYITGRTKSRASTLEKMIRKPKYTHPSMETDLSGVRIESDNVKKIYSDIGKFKELGFKILEENDYINTPNDKYRAFHIVAEKDGLVFEVQFRTPNQTKWADFTHESIYKEHMSGERAKLINDNRAELTDYVKKMSDYYYEIDMGRVAVLPEPSKHLLSIINEIHLPVLKTFIMNKRVLDTMKEGDR